MQKLGKILMCISILLLLEKKNINMTLRRKKSLFRFLVHISAGMLQLGLLNTTLYLATPLIEYQRLYLKFSMFFYMGSINIVIISAVIGISRKEKIFPHIAMPSDLRKVFISLNDAVFLFNSNDELLDCNPTAKRVYSYHEFSLQELLLYLLSSHTEEERERILNNVRKRCGEVTFECGGKGKDFLITVFFVYNRKKHLVNTNVIMHDITKEKNLHEKLQMRNDTLIRSNELYEKQLQIINELQDERARLTLLQTIQNSLLVQVEDVMKEVQELQTENIDDKSWEIQMVALTEKIRDIIAEVRKSVVNLKV